MKTKTAMKRAGIVFALACMVAALLALTACGSSSSSSASSSASGTAVSAASSASSAASESASSASASAAEEVTVTKEVTLDAIDISEGTEISEEEAEASEEATLADVADSSDAADKGTQTSQGKVSYKMESDYLDKYGNATILAFTELDGWEFYSMIREHGYTVLDSYAWTRGSTGSLAFFDAQEKIVGPYSMKKLEKAGGGKNPACFMSIVGDYKNAKACLEGVAPMVHDKTAYSTAGDFGVAVAYGPSMEKIAIMVQANKKGGFDVYAFGKDYLATGALAKKLGGSFTDADGFFAFFTGTK